MKFFPFALAFVSIIGLRGVAQSSPQTSLQVSPTPIPIASNGFVFELRLPEGKIQFQQGETIPIRLLFSNKGPQKLYLNTYSQSPPSAATFAEFTAQPQEGASDPFSDLPRPTVWVYEGPPPPAPRVLTSKPEEVVLTLNEYVRFDRPGTYQLHATTDHVFILPQVQSFSRQDPFFERGATVTSSPVTIEIISAQPQWQQEQVAAWRTYWSKQTPDPFGFGWGAPSGVLSPTNDLRFLNTRAAAQAMIDRLGQDIAPRSSGSEAYFWRSGFIAFSERLWLIDAMKQAVARPNYAVTQGFLDTLSTLQALYHTPHSGQALSTGLMAPQQESASLANWQLAFEALPSKRGRARAMTVHSLLESAWGSRLGKTPSIQRHLSQLTAMVPDIFNALPVLPQQYLLNDRKGLPEEGLSDEWDKIKSPRFAQPLLTAWETVPHAQNGGMERDILILCHLYELSPQTARPIILQEMVSSHPRVPFEVLSLLSDRYLPQLQNIWWSYLTSPNRGSGENEIFAQLIARYATPALKTQVQTMYKRSKREGGLPLDIDRDLKRYLKRYLMRVNG